MLCANTTNAVKHFGTTEHKVKRLERALEVGASYGLWIAHNFIQGNQTLYIRRVPAEIPNFTVDVKPMLLLQAIDMKRSKEKAADTATTHHSVGPLVKRYLGTDNVPEQAGPVVQSRPVLSSLLTAVSNARVSAASLHAPAAEQASLAKRQRTQRSRARHDTYIATWGVIIPNLSDDAITNLLGGAQHMEAAGVIEIEFLNLKHIHKDNEDSDCATSHAVEGAVLSEVRSGQQYQVMFTLTDTTPLGADPTWVLESLPSSSNRRKCSCAATGACKHIAAVLKAVADGAEEGGLLGERDEGCPAEVHEKASRMLWGRDIQRTTLLQRSRNKFSGMLECPETYADLVRWGYVSANYQWAPKNHTIVQSNGKVIFHARGG